ncbi:MAG: tRNA guanosine(34) transglycosylase Tgt [Chitinophagales bacterium]|nr:tRNA guanosine(34) transglycosylase Tgt [Chitinophagales bacterium]MDW8428481.1 tRNA guanosine(34) transglycosylase Tgt [Chitinophagales bacterium]
MLFTITAEDSGSQARAGRLVTAHGIVDTPVFMPIGTSGAVKAVHFHELEHDIGVSLLLANTYHLFVRPGEEVIRRAGGLHAFTGWKRALLSDSGGYQVFSLADRRKVTEQGVIFHSHVDGARHLFTPEKVIDIQRILGCDIVMAFDEVVGYPVPHRQAKNAMERTHRWLDRCLIRFEQTQSLYGFQQVLFPIVQGGVYSDLRRCSAEFVAEKRCAGNAIGGLSVGEPAELMYEQTDLVCRILPRDKPRYLMGVGMPDNLLECIAMGVDMFDCVIPTRNGRNGMLFTRQGIINIRNKKWQFDYSPLDELLDNPVSRNHSRAFLRHLIMNHELLGYQVASLHNLYFYHWLMQEARAHIIAGDFSTWKERTLKEVMQRL